MNWVFFMLIAAAYGTTVWHQWRWTAQNDATAAPINALTEQLLHAANDAVTLCIGLIGVLALFLGLMRIIEEGGLLKVMAKLIYPFLKWLFPEIPANHPAFGAMMMNLSANMLGLGNAATPFGLKAMQELDKLNPNPGTATNAMILFLALNTSCITLLPTKIIALRAASGSHDPGGIISTTLVATIGATVIAVLSAKLLAKFFHEPNAPAHSDVVNDEAIEHYPTWICLAAIIGLILLVPFTLYYGKYFSPWLIPSFIIAVLGFGLIKKIDIYASFIEGAKAGFDLAIKILPYAIAILVAIGMLRTSGALDAITHALGPFTDKIGLPAEALPMVFLRPLSGSGSFGVLSEVLNNPALGPDSYTGYLVSTIMGSTETTFYVLAVYFGAVQIKRIRHALAVGLLADLASLVMSIIAVKMLFFS